MVSLVKVQAESLDEILVTKSRSEMFTNLTTVDTHYNKIALLSSSSKNYVGFFELDEKIINVSVVGAREAPISLNGKLSFFKAQIDEVEADKLRRFLNSLGIRQVGVDEIVGELLRGVNGSRQCKGNKSDCIVFDPEFITVVDFYNNSLRLFVPDKWFERSEQKIVLDVSNESLLVSSWYGSISYTDEANYFLRSENIYGLGNGYIKYDFNMSEYDTTVGQFNYNYDAKSYSLTGGIISNTQRLGVAGQNSIINDRFVGFEISNQKLLEVNNFSARNVEFFSPSDGVLTVYKTNRQLIYQGNIQPGRNTIPYSLLPYGNYAISYEVTKSDNIVFKGDNFVSNSDAFDASDFSTYARFGMNERDLDPEKSNMLFDTGFSLPLYQQHSLIGSASLVEEEWFFGLGYYANVDDYRFSMKYSHGKDANQVNLDLYSQLFNLSVSNTDVKDGKRSYFGTQDSLLISAGLTKGYGLLSFGLSTSYNKLGFEEYLNYNINSSYSFKNGVSLYATYSGGDYQNMLTIGASIPLSSLTNYNATFTNYQGRLELDNQITNSYRVNEQLAINGGVSHRYGQDINGGIDAYINGNYRNRALTSSIGIRRQKDGNFTYNGSFSTTAYVTQNNIYFKDTRSSNSSAIEIVGNDEKPNGRIKLYDKVSGQRKFEAITGEELLDMKPYSQVVVDYDFDSDKFALADINIERNTSVNLLPGKIHYIKVKQQPIGHVLVVSSGSDTNGIICTGAACIDQKNVKNKVVKFRVKPEQHFAIHRNSEMCFSGKVEQGQTNIGVCRN